jgi:hypothetical protein
MMLQRDLNTSPLKLDFAPGVLIWLLEALSFSTAFLTSQDQC